MDQIPSPRREGFMRLKACVSKTLSVGLILLLGSVCYAKLVNVVEERIPYEMIDPDITASLQIDRGSLQSTRAWLEVVLRERSPQEEMRSEAKTVRKYVTGLSYDPTSKMVVYSTADGKAINCADVTEKTTFYLRSISIQMRDNCQLRVSKLEESGIDPDTVINDTYANHFSTVAIVEFSVSEP